ncbi:MAG: hypothetical protein R3335_11620, partial [Anaerolineales bacterium]|nr:hypothetical protein [Anaerolineales bacterium]
FNLSTAFFFELAIGLTVLGSLALILDAFGRPPREMESAPEARLELASSGQPDPVNVPMKGGAAVAAAGLKPPAEDATG